MCNCPYLHFVNINAFTKFIKIHQLVHKILSIKGISASIKGHNSVENERKILFNHHLHLVSINAYTKYDQNPQINSQDIEHKQNSEVDQDNSVKN